MSNPAIKEELQKLYDKLDGIETISVVTVEGYPMETFPEVLPEGIDPTRFSAMSSALLALGQRAMMEVGFVELDRILIESATGNLVTISAGLKAVLTVSAKKNLKIGLLLYDLKQTAEAIASLLDGSDSSALNF